MKRINCDVFMKDGSTLDLLNKVICITGNFYAGKNCSVSTAIIAGGSVILEDYADTASIWADGDVSIGDFANVLSVSSSKSISLGDFSSANDIFATEDVVMGYQADAYSITAGGDIIENRYCKLRTFWRKLCMDIKYFFNQC